jgi:IclR family pca regulon transcriptional regulator
MSSKKQSTAEEKPRTERLESLERGLRVLELFGQGTESRFAMIEVADELGITRASALRILATLEDMGYVRLEGRAYGLTPRVLALGYSYLASLGFRAIARPILEDLVRVTKETASVGVLDGADVVYVAREEARRLIRIDLNVGSRLPAYLNSMGRVLMSALPDAALDAQMRAVKLTKLASRTVADKRQLKARIVEIRKAGYCYIDGEVDDRIAGLAMPLVDRDGKVIAALNLSLGFGRHGPKEVERNLIPLLRKAAQKINAVLHNDVPIA